MIYSRAHERWNLLNRHHRGRSAAKVVIGLATLLALLSASCCVLLIGLSIVGLGGAWLAVPGPFVAYRSAILVAIGLVLLWAWFRLIRRSRWRVRQPGAVALAVFASLSFLVAASSPIWEERAARTMMDMWSATQ